MGFLIGAVLLALLLQPRGDGQGLGCCLVWVALRSRIHRVYRFAHHLRGDACRKTPVIQERIIDILKASLGECGTLLEDARLVELMVNDDGRVWVEWQGNSRCELVDYVMAVASGRM